MYKKMLLGGLLTKGIKSAYKAYRKTGKSKREVMKDSKIREEIAKSDVKSGVRDELKGRLQKETKDFKADKSNFLKRRKRLMTIRDLNLLK
jgi:hypothetical protein|tara:strand:+ start:1355 stop:1627 length:273 start_codon:yes stop_codon:yes gene_type:complete